MIGGDAGYKSKRTVMTSSPGPIPAASRARCKALVPEFNAMHSPAPQYSREFFFECRHLGAEDELTAFQHPRDGGINFRLDALILRF